MFRRCATKSQSGQALKSKMPSGLTGCLFSRTSDSPLVPALAKLEKALRLDRLAGISLWVIVRFRAADAPAGPDGHPD